MVAAVLAAIRRKQEGGARILTGADQFELIYWMLLTRCFDENMVACQSQGRGSAAPSASHGHEAISVGAGYALAPDDVVAPMHRDLGTYLLRGLTPRRIFGNLWPRHRGSAGRDANLQGMGDLDWTSSASSATWGMHFPSLWAPP